MPIPLSRGLPALSLLLAAALPGACATVQSSVEQALPGSTAALAVVTERPRLTDADEERLAQQSALEFEAAAPLRADPLLEQYLTAVVQRIAAVAEPRPFVYRVRVVDDPGVNAFTFGGGLLYLHLGLLARMENEAQLAMILAHEIAHVTERHIPEGIEGRYGIRTAGRLVGGESATDSSAIQAYAYTMGAVTNGHGRRQEAQADEVGLDYLVRAGYDPREAPRAMAKLYEEHGDPSPARNFFYGDHPTSRARMERLTELVAGAYAAQAAEGGRAVNSDEFRRRTRTAVIEAGVLDYEEKRFRTARAMFEKVLPLSAGDPVPHYYLGKILLETGGDVGEAVAHLSRAVAADEGFAPARRELGLAHYRRGEGERAAAELERYLELQPDAEDAAAIRETIAELRRR